MIAQYLSAAQQSIPSPSVSNGHAVFLIHSMHCYFVLAGDAAIPIVYYVERVRDGKSFITRTVQARQKGKCIFTTTLSFVREGSAGKATVNHGWDMPADALPKLNSALKEQNAASDTDAEALGVQGSGPFETIRLPIENSECRRIARELQTSSETLQRRYLLSHRHQENPAVGQSPRPHLLRLRPAEPPFRPRSE